MFSNFFLLEYKNFSYIKESIYRTLWATLQPEVKPKARGLALIGVFSRLAEGEGWVGNDLFCDINCNVQAVPADQGLLSSQFFFFFFFRARVCLPLLRLCRPFMIFEGCLDSNPECCRSKLARYRLSHLSLYRLSHPPSFCQPQLNVEFIHIRNFGCFTIARQIQTNPWPTMPDWPWCRNADARSDAVDLL